MTDEKSTTDSKDSAQEEMRPFATILMNLDKGRAHDQATEKLNDLVAAVRETGKKGTLTLTFTVDTYNRSAMEIGVRVAAKVPEPAPNKSILFDDKHHNLVPDDPSQQRIPGIA